MFPSCPSRLPIKCFYSNCPSRSESPISTHLVRKGAFYRSSDSKYVSRFQCRHCNRTFSSGSSSPCFLQKRRRLNEPIRKLFASGNSQAQITRILKTNPKTVARKLLFLAAQAGLRMDTYLEQLRLSGSPLTALQFDEMETFEKSKCLPVSIPLIVDPATRKILAIAACSMPAKGLLAKASVQKYGRRVDDRGKATHALFAKIAPLSASKVKITTDQNPKYPAWIRQHFPESRHIAVKGRRARTAGLGELKVGAHDPIFELNHTAAMIRANVSRLFRRTWNTSKRIDRLMAHLLIYADYHNNELT